MLRIVPWACREEWLEVYNNLYNFDDVEQQTKGIQRVEAWKSRSGNKLPLAIEATASLIAAGVVDVRSQVSSYVLRHTMAMVIVRFVNGMVDMEQKGVYARSVQSIADEIGIPDWLVDLRHEATHAVLPSLEVLRAGSRFALDWLRDHYWESQIAEFRERHEQLVALLEKYALLCENGTSTKKMAKKSKVKHIAQEIADLVGKYAMWETFLELAFEEGLLLPTFETLQELFPVTSSDKTNTNPTELPKDVRQWLTPLLKALNKVNNKFFSNFVGFLLQKLHKLQQSSGNEILAHFYACWIYFILFNCSKKNSEQKQWMVKAELDYLTLLEVGLQNPSTYRNLFLPLIIDNLEITSKNLKEKFYKFSTINVTLNQDTSLNEQIQDEKNSFEILNQQFPLVAKQVLKSTKSEVASSGWKKCPPSFARRYKFGAFIGKEPGHKKQPPLNEETMGVEINFQDGTANVEGMMNDSPGSEIVEDDGNECEMSELCRSETNETSQTTVEELTKEMIKDISKNILIF